MYDRSGDGTGSSEVKIRTNTAKFTNMIIAKFRESRYLVRESEVFIKGNRRQSALQKYNCEKRASKADGRRSKFLV